MNIYNIQQELLSIFNELEENGGELTPELEKALEISQEDFKDKIKSFTNVIKLNNNDIDAIDSEILRLTMLKKHKQSIIERVTKIIIDAVELFGDTSKAGAKFVDYGDGKVSIRKSDKVEVDETSYKGIVSEFASLISFRKYCNELDTNYDVSPEELISRCNQEKGDIYKTEFDDNNESADPNIPITIDKEELPNIKANLVLNVKLVDLMNHAGYDLLKDIIAFDPTYSIKPVINKTDLKNTLKDNPNALPNIAKITKNKTITIK